MTREPPDAGDPGLVRIQTWFQAVITHPGGAAAGLKAAAAHGLAPVDPLASVTRSRNLDAVERLAIYAHAYYARLVEVMEGVFPAACRALGEDAFRGFVFAYLQEHPSRSYTLDRLGQSFPDWLSRTRPSGSGDEGEGLLPADWSAMLVDLTRLEWEIGRVFDGPGAEDLQLLGPEELARLDPGDWPGLRLGTVPCLRIFTSDYAVNDWYTELRFGPEDVIPPLPERRACHVLLTRREWVVRRLELDRCPGILLGALQSGATVGEALQAAAGAHEAPLQELVESVRGWFRDWAAMGLFLALGEA